MPSKKNIKLRIKSVSTTRQIVKAMNLVAASKLGQLKARVERVRPLFLESKRIIDNLAGCADISENVFVMPRDVKNTGYVLVTSDSGLCGSYNNNAVVAAYKQMEGKSEKILAVGTKGRDYFIRRGKNVFKLYADTAEHALHEDAVNIAETVISMYLSGEVDEVYVGYTEFVSAMHYEPRIVKVLPIGGPDVKPKFSFIGFEPDANNFMDSAVREYIKSFIFGAMVESVTSMQASRMISMDSATKNAGEIIEDLTLKYNRKRQADITQEITEIVSGASVTK